MYRPLSWCNQSFEMLLGMAVKGTRRRAGDLLMDIDDCIGRVLIDTSF
jgi:hypothetical protein